MRIPLVPMEKTFQEMRGRWRYLWNLPRFRKAPASTLYRLARWRLHCALGIPATVNLNPWGVRLFLPARWHGAGTTMIFAVGAHYESELRYLHHFVTPGMVVVDGGANCGIYTMAAAKLVGPSGRILSFEPGAEAFAALTKNIELNRLSNVCARRAALSDRKGKTRLYHFQPGPNSFSIGRPVNEAVESEEVATRTLDEIFREEKVDRVGLIKLDVEGAEELVLRGAGEIIAHSYPTIIFEVNATAAKRLGLHPSGAWNLLLAMGYRFLFLIESGELRELDRPPAADAIRNIIAVHGGQQK